MIILTGPNNKFTIPLNRSSYATWFDQFQKITSNLYRCKILLDPHSSIVTLTTAISPLVVSHRFSAIQKISTRVLESKSTSC